MAIVGLPTLDTLFACVDRQRATKLTLERCHVARTAAHEKLITARDDERRRRAQIVLAAAEEAVRLAANDAVQAEHDMYRAKDYLMAPHAEDGTGQTDAGG